MIQVYILHSACSEYYANYTLEDTIENGIQQELDKRGGSIVYVVNVIIINQEQTETEKSYNSRLILLIIFIVFMVIIIFAYIYSKYIHINDYFRSGSLFIASIYIMNVISDAFLRTVLPSVFYLY